METILSPFDLLSGDAASRVSLENPVVVARPHRARVASAWFANNLKGKTFYAVKANPAPWALDAVWAGGVRGFDVASEQEAALVRGRFPDAELAFMHPVKSRRAIARAYHDFGVRIFSLDCADELDKIRAETGGADDLTLIVRLAVSCDDAAYPLARKFGIAPSEAAGLLRRVRQATSDCMGVSFHVGSQCMDPSAFRRAMEDANRAIVDAGVVVDIVDVGGGFPAIYPGMNPAPLRAYLDVIHETFENMFVAYNAELWAEPGRALVAESASVIARVELRKDDALYLNDGAYGNLFDAAHVKWPFPVRLLRSEGSEAEQVPFRFFGPTCDSIDAAQGPFMLPGDIREGDLIEIGQLGAYGAAMATRFNGFGESDTVIAFDAPWASMYGPAEAPVVALPRRDHKRAIARKR